MGESIDGFGQREKAFEAKYLHDEELNFRITAKRNHLFGLWAADLLGYTDEKGESYVQEIIVAEVQGTHDEDVLHKVLRDLEMAKVQISEHRVRKEFERCWEEARQMVIGEEGGRKLIS